MYVPIYLFISSTNYPCSVTDGLSLFVSPFRLNVCPRDLMLFDNLDF